MIRSIVLALSAAVLLLSGCGLKYDLYMPPQDEASAAAAPPATELTLLASPQDLAAGTQQIK